MRKVLMVFATLALFSLGDGEAQEGNRVLTLGRLTTNSMGARQILSVENKGPKTFESVEWSADFTRAATSLGTDRHSSNTSSPVR